MKLNNKGFSLVEMLAVVAILGILSGLGMIAYSRIVQNSKLDIYLNIVKMQKNAVAKLVNSDEYYAEDDNTVYYFDYRLLDDESIKKSPFADWAGAYVIVTYNGKKYSYYWTGVDKAGWKIDLNKQVDELTRNDIYNVNSRTIIPGKQVGGRDNIVIYDKDGNETSHTPTFELSKEEATKCFTLKSINNNEFAITDYNSKCGTKVQVPSVIEGQKVTLIEENAFRNKGLTEVYLYFGITELKNGIVDITNDVKPIYKDIAWQNGYIDKDGVVKKSSRSKYAVISLKSNETVYVGTININITMLGKTNSNTVSVGDTVTPIKITSPYERFEDYTYYTLEDVKIVVCVLASNYELKFYEKPFFLNEDTKVFHVTDYVTGAYFNTGRLNDKTNRVRASNFFILNKGEAVDVKDIPYGYELNISFFDFTTKELLYGDKWGGLYPYVAREKVLMLPVWRRTDNADLSPSEITGDVVIYGTCLSDIKYNDSVIASNLGIQDKINQANHYRTNDTKPLCLAHISDLHLDKIRLKRFTNFINDIKNIDDAICTGDMTYNYSNGMSYWDSVRDAERILTCIGNHDGLANNNVDWYSGQCTMLEAYNKFMSPYISNWNVTYEVGKTYYYKDYDSEKIRLIVLDCMRSGTDATNQNTWLESVLSSAKSKGFSVVCATHCVPQTSKVNYIDCTFNSINLKYEDEYDTCVTNTIYQQTVQNFIDAGGKFITWICGHTHVDFVYTTSEFPNQLWIVVACGLLSNKLDIDRTDGTKNQDAFNILTFDTNTELVKIIRVGADRDRSMRHLGTMSINYNTHNVIYND